MLQIVKTRLTFFSFRPVPTLWMRAPCDPETQVFFLVVNELVFTTVLRGQFATVGPSKLKHPEVGVLVVRVARNGFQALKNQALSHGTQVRAQRIEHGHTFFWRQIPVLHKLCIRGLGQRVGHDFTESEMDQELTPTEQNVFAAWFFRHLKGSRHA